ncbi:MAG: GreA/GreB family elongation factor [Clostridia bacterium]|jgi:transcription elongation factor GreA|nr:GreA/GreB family elongation factor [Clostridia bacterium]
MADKVMLSQTTFDRLVQQVHELEERKIQILEEYFPEAFSERAQLKALFDDYIGHLQSLIKNSRITSQAADQPPFVLVGSEVEVIDLADDRLESFVIVAPFQDTIEGNMASFLSPIGKALLLKKVGDTVTVHAPGGTFQYKINSIKFAFK